MSRRRKSDKQKNRKETPEIAPVQDTVYVRESSDSSWSEAINVKIVSSFGAGFDVTRECRLGTLIRLELALPNELRAFDHDKEVYSVIALVQHCNRIGKRTDDGYHMSVIFVGKEFPDSYTANPAQAYRLTGAAQDGLWRVTECTGQFKQRKYPRFDIKLNVELGLIQSSRRTIVKEQTITRDIGSSGVSVVSGLDAKRGDKVKFACRDIDFYAIAVVVNRRNLFGEKDLLHMKFVDHKFPIERILFSSAGDAESAPMPHDVLRN